MSMHAPMLCQPVEIEWLLSARDKQAYDNADG